MVFFTKMAKPTSKVPHSNASIGRVQRALSTSTLPRRAPVLGWRLSMRASSFTDRTRQAPRYQEKYPILPSQKHLTSRHSSWHPGPPIYSTQDHASRAHPVEGLGEADAGGRVLRDPAAGSVQPPDQLAGATGRWGYGMAYPRGRLDFNEWKSAGHGPVLVLAARRAMVRLGMAGGRNLRAFSRLVRPGGRGGAGGGGAVLRGSAAGVLAAAPRRGPLDCRRGGDCGGQRLERALPGASAYLFLAAVHHGIGDSG